ncbi:glycoside hydrolase family 88 protein [Allokutzneria sp. A3M-2-11 16]|uniref:glycoside hydrolase family 88/105 protein n=1 Tax=Allokutzneria sp. A3M-2-11 16 TaxID=2962043 RepID=UPI0020B64520|nr:glycoside hydrolase family 88 protein [Allokutzneria sp. A3M-2-11 16]MCP3804765.1 glycoside hydrolase family 88 protein [Allokutzneria sp. A3M-2-11 16]
MPSPQPLSRVAVLLVTAMLSFPIPANAAPDWSKSIVDSTMKRHTPATLGGWGYTRGLYLYAQYLVYKRTGDKRYLSYIKEWVDRFVAEDGSIQQSFTHLDEMRSGTLLVILHAETGQAKYRKAADKIRAAITGYPRTSDGGMWHAKGKVGQLWADGVYMAQPFLAMYGKEYGDGAYAYEEAVDNMAVYFKHLKADNGLLWHAYDEQGDEPWANNPGKHSAEHWARAIGWFGMAAIDLLEILPADHPRRAELIGIVQHLARGYERYQDKATGRWFQVVDKGSDARNWTETSASAMYTFMLSRGVQRGFLDARYRTVASKGYRGVLAKVSVNPDGLTDVRDISEGTNVGDASYYFNRKRNTNDLHGLGAFLIMSEQLRTLG